MGEITDIRNYKSALRAKYIAMRKKITAMNKAEMDAEVLKRILMLNQYNVADTVLTYVSKEIEVGTKELIDSALKDGKKVAVPACVPGTRTMNFYYIDSLNDLSVKSFGVLEPEMNVDRQYKVSEHTICFVPGICFDRDGYRLGYGKGYYDRFLADFDGITVGLCYEQFIRGHLQHGKYDFPVNMIITERHINRTTGRIIIKEGNDGGKREG